MNQTKRILLSAAAIVAVAAVPAAAHGPADHPEQAKGPKAEKHQAKSPAKGVKHCTPRKKAYVASGVLEAAALTKNADGTYDGTLTIAVKQANRHGRAHKGTSQTFTLDDAKVNLPDADGSGTVDAADAKPGQRAKVIGKITTLRKRCDASAFTPEVTVRKATLKQPKTETAPAQEPAAPAAS